MSEAEQKDTPEQAEFRAYVRKWLKDNKPAKPPFRLPQSPLEVMTEEQRVYLCAWQKKCYDAGLIGTDIPKAYGGGGATDKRQRIVNQEMGHADVPYFINVIGLGMAAPTILVHGTEEQKRRYVPGILSSDEIWCQGFSEPGAGSDLANSQTFAEKRGDMWVINGHKVWTSLAHFASWMILLCRTSRDDKYKGLSYFIVPIKGAKGVTVRPLIKITGETGFNEVLFDNLEVPDTLRLDQVGNGWNVAMTTLLYERGAAESAGRAEQSLSSVVDRLISLGKKTRRDGRPAIEDPVLRDRIVQFAIRAEGIKQTFRRARVPALTGNNPMRIPLQGKLIGSEFNQEAAALALEIEGQKANYYLGDSRAPDNGAWPLAYMNSYGITIAAGTSEIQRNILGERVLNLPKSK